jgi:hypothetical protein
VLHRAAKGGVDMVSLRIDDPAECPVGLNPPCQPNAQPIVAAIDKAVSLGVDAINISLALKSDPAIEQAIGRAARSGVRVVLAAGNNGADHPGNLAMAIAGYPNTVLVGALDPFGEPWAKSNRPDVRSGTDYNFDWRPGVDIATTNADGSAARASGTSIAAPMETAFVLMNEPPRLGDRLEAQRVPEVTAVTAKEPGAKPEVTTASSTAAATESYIGRHAASLLHMLYGFLLALALYPLAFRLARPRLR